MKNAKKIMLLIFLMCNNVNAAWHIWLPNEPINVSGTINFPSGVTQGSFYFTSNLGYGSGTVLAEDCSNNNVNGSKWFYLALPDRVNVGSDGAYLSFQLNGAGFQFHSRVNGWDIYTKRDSYKYDKQECFGVGTVFQGVIYNWGSPRVDVTLHDDYKLKPGTYNVSNGFRYIFREDRGVDTPAANQAAIKNLLYGSNIHSFVVKLDYTPKCKINVSHINLSFGEFSPAEANGRISNRVPFNITCDKEATVELSLKGNQPVLGKTENYTSCEKNNSCAFVFDDGRSYRKKFTKTLVINDGVRARFEPDGKIIAGKFQGAGVLTMYFH